MQTPATATTLATVDVTIAIPARSSEAAKRRPQFVSPATQSITVQVDNGTATTQNLSPSSADCTNAGADYPTNCTVPVFASPGAHTVTFVTYDGSNAAGNKLSANAIAVTFVSGQTPSIPVVLAGVPASLHVVPANPSSAIGGSQSAGYAFVANVAQKLLVTALDADGNVIVGPGAPALAVSVSGATAGSGIAVTPAGQSDPNAFTISSTGLGSATLGITATPASGVAGNALSANVALTTTTYTATIAGTNGSMGFGDSPGTEIFYYPAGIAYDSNNGNLYVTDTLNCAIRQVTTPGVVTTIAGDFSQCHETDDTDKDGSGTNATFNMPSGIAYDAANDTLYVSDTYNCAIRSVTPAGAVITLAGQRQCGSTDASGTSAQFKYPAGIAVDAGDGNLYVTDTQNCTVRQVTTAGAVKTIAGNASSCSTSTVDGDGMGTTATFKAPSGIAYDPADGNLYVLDACAVRKVTTSGSVVTFAGSTTCGTVDATGTAARFNTPLGITYDAGNGDFYVSDAQNCTVRQITPSAVVTTVSGGTSDRCESEDGLGLNAGFYYPASVAYDGADGNLYVTDKFANTIRQVQL